MPASLLNIRRHDGYTRVEFVEKNILDEGNLHQIEQEIRAAIETATSPRVLICFKNVEHMSSAALGTLLALKDSIEKKSGELRLSDIDRRIYEMFVITKLNRLFSIHDSVEQAASSFTKK